jgi:hypothetical protein
MAASAEQRVRSAALSRDTNETKIQLAINLDGGEFPSDTDSRLVNGVKGGEGHATQASKSQTIAINSGIGFLDHMLHALAKHAGWSLALNCKGDLHSRLFKSLDTIQRQLKLMSSSGQSTITIPLKMCVLHLDQRSKMLSARLSVLHDSDPHMLLSMKLFREQWWTSRIDHSV